MAEISNLMGQFADKIMEQQTDIELIHQHAQETKTNITQVGIVLIWRSERSMLTSVVLSPIVHRATGSSSTHKTSDAATGL